MQVRKFFSLHPGYLILIFYLRCFIVIACFFNNFLATVYFSIISTQDQPEKHLRVRLPPD